MPFLSGPYSCFVIIEDPRYFSFNIVYCIGYLQVYSVPLGGMVQRQPFSIGGSGSTYVYGHVDHCFKEGMTKEQCLDFTANSESTKLHDCQLFESYTQGLSTFFRVGPFLEIIGKSEHDGEDCCWFGKFLQTDRGKKLVAR